MARVITGEKRADVYIHSEQITNCILVFCSVEATESVRTARIGIQLSFLIERPFQVIDQAFISSLIRPRESSRRHIAGSNLAEDLLPNFVRLLYAFYTGRGEGKPSGLQS